MASKPYNGHASWNAWNVALWIGNDEGIYNLALDCVKRAGKRYGRAAHYFIASIGESKTPDGARYSVRSVTAALRGLDS